MATVSWQSLLNGAHSESAVVGIARDFVAQFSHEEIASLPPACRPYRFVDGEDIADYAFTLVNHVTGGDSPSALLVEKLAAFFSHASFRVSALLAMGHQGGEGDLRSGDRVR